MRERIERWVYHCDHCGAAVTPNESIRGLDPGYDDFGGFETQFGCICVDEDNCWCNLDCLTAWLRAQVSKLMEEAA